jgi:hypothetical protein
MGSGADKPTVYPKPQEQKILITYEDVVKTALAFTVVSKMFGVEGAPDITTAEPGEIVEWINKKWPR